MISRRNLLKQAVLAPGMSLVSGLRASQEQVTFSDQDEAFLDELERATCLYFWGAGESPNGTSERPVQRARGRSRDRGQHSSHRFRIDRSLHMGNTAAISSYPRSARPGTGGASFSYGKSCPTIGAFPITSPT